MGGVYRFKDGREVPDHVFATFEYPGGITGTFSSVESNAFDERYEAFFGTKGTLIISNENDAMLFDEGEARPQPPAWRSRRRGAGARARDVGDKAGAGRRRRARATRAAERGARHTISPSTYEINAFASAIRCGTPLNCGPEKASHSASWTIAANEAMKTGQIVKIP